MGLTVYVDALLAVNFAVDFLILKAAAAFCGIKAATGRLALGAAVGAAGALAIFLPLSGGGQWALCALCSAASCAAAFCPCRMRLLAKAIAASLLLALLFSGAVLLWQLKAAPVGVYSFGGSVYFDISAPALLLCCVAGYIAACFLSRLLQGRIPPGMLCGVTVMHNGAAARLEAIIDSGSSLTEPFSGAPVIVCELSALGETVPQAARDFCAGKLPAEGLRLVPYRTLDSSGLLPAFLPEKLQISAQGEEFAVDGCYIAVKDGALGECYRALCSPGVFSYKSKAGDELYEKTV